MSKTERDGERGPGFPKTYFMRPFLRGFFLLGAIGYCVLLGTMISEVAGDVGTFSGALVAVAGFVFLGGLGLTFLLVPVLTPSVRLDERGVYARGVIFRTFRPWEDFQGGHMHKRSGDFYYHPPDGGEPKEFLEFFPLSRRDAQEVLDICRSRWLRPVRALTPSEVRISYRIRSIRPGRLRIFFGGIDLGRGKRWKHYSWEDVESIEIMRYEHDDENFLKLSLKLGSDRVRLIRLAPEGKFWKVGWWGAEPEEVLSVIHEFAPPENVKDFSLSGRPRDMDDLENREKHFERKAEGWRNSGWLAIFFVLLWFLLGVLPWFTRYSSTWGITFVLTFLLLGNAALFWMAPRMIRNRQAKWIARWREELEQLDDIAVGESES